MSFLFGHSTWRVRVPEKQAWCLGCWVFALVWICGAADVSAAPTTPPPVGPFQLVFHNNGDTYAGSTGTRDWTATEIQAATDAAQGWAVNLNENLATPTTTVEIHLMFDDTSGFNALAKSPVAAETASGEFGTRAELVVREAIAADDSDLPPATLIRCNDSISFNTELDLERAIASGARDLRSLVAHEMGHALGFTSTRLTTSGGDFNGFDDPLTEYDKRLQDSQNRAPTPGGAAADFTATDGGVTWTGPAANAALGSPVPLYSPSTWASASSLVHPDIDNALMFFSHSGDSRDTAVRAANQVELAMLQDIGWSTATGSRYIPAGTTATISDNLLAGALTAALVLNGNSSNIIQTGQVNATGVGTSGVQILGSGNILELQDFGIIRGDGAVGVMALGQSNELINRATIQVQDSVISSVGNDARAFGVFFEWADNRLENFGSIDARGANSYGVFANGSLTLVNRGEITASHNPDPAIFDPSTAIYNNSAWSNLYFLNNSAVNGDIVQGGAAGSVIHFGMDEANVIDPDFRFSYHGTIDGLWDLNFAGGITSLSADALISNSHSMLVQSNATLRGEAAMDTRYLQVAGRLVRQGNALFADEVEVSDGGRFIGTGPTYSTIFDNNRGGTIAPGDTLDWLGTSETNEIGTLSFHPMGSAASYFFTSGDLEIDVDGQGTAGDLIEVEDMAVINGGKLEVTSQTATPDVGTQHTFLRAGDLDVDTPLTPTDNMPTRRAILRNDATDYWMVIARDTPYDVLGRTPNEIAVGEALNSLKGDPVGNPNWVAAFDELDLMPDDADVRWAMNQLTGEIYSTTLTMQIQNLTNMNQFFAGETRAKLFGPDGVCGSEHGWTGSVTGYGDSGMLESDGNAHGTTASRGGTYLTVGKCLDKDTSAGFFFNSDSQFVRTMDVASSATMQDYRFGGYLARRVGDDYYMISATGGFGDYEYDRFAVVGTLGDRLAANPSGGNWSFYLERGRQVDFGHVRWTPFAGLQYAGLVRLGVTESSANDRFQLTVGESELHSMKSLIGSRFEMPAARYGSRFALDTAWLHEFLNDTGSTVALASGNAAAFHVSGVDVGDDLLLVAPNLQVELLANLDLYVSYGLSLTDRQVIHVGTGSLTWSF